MKKAFAVSGLAVWTLGLLVGLGFAVVGHVNATNQLPWKNLQLINENQSLESEQDALQELVESQRSRGDEYLGVIGLQNNLLLHGTTSPQVTTLGPWPREE